MYGLEFDGLCYPTCCPLVRFSHIGREGSNAPREGSDAPREGSDASKMLRATGHARMVTVCADGSETGLILKEEHVK